ncbi:MAG: hypothetical protein AAFQ85_02920, partial [Pseudomonadota bacterium]
AVLAVLDLRHVQHDPVLQRRRGARRSELHDQRLARHVLRQIRRAPRRRHPRANLLPLFDPRASRPPPDWAAIKAARSPDTRLPSHRLRARASAAAAVIEDPSAMAQRLARWMRRRAQRAAAPITERSRPERAQIVGIRPPRRAGLTRAECAALRELTQAGRAAWPPPGPPLAAP